MRTLQTRSKVRFALIAGLATCAGMLASHDAEAAYVGFIVRSVCMAGAMVPLNPDRTFWSNVPNRTCSAKVIDTGSATADHYARVSIPVERQRTPTMIQATVHVNAGAFGNGRVCARLWIASQSGALRYTAQKCSAGSFGEKYLTTAVLTLPVSGAALIEISAQNGGEADVVALHWIAKGD